MYDKGKDHIGNVGQISNSSHMNKERLLFEVEKDIRNEVNITKCVIFFVTVTFTRSRYINNKKALVEVSFKRYEEVYKRLHREVLGTHWARKKKLQARTWGFYDVGMKSKRTPHIHSVMCVRDEFKSKMDRFDEEQYFNDAKEKIKALKIGLHGIETINVLRSDFNIGRMLGYSSKHISNTLKDYFKQSQYYHIFPAIEHKKNT